MTLLAILLAAYLNRRQKEALLLTLTVGLGVLMPITSSHGALIWYSICAAIECSIFIVALCTSCTASIPIAMLSVLFILVHFLGYTFDGYIAKSPYHYFAQTLEYTEILTCAILSNPIINFFREKIK